MRTAVCSLLILICSMAVFPCTSLAQDTLPIVRLIYFLPNDRAPQPDIDAEMGKLIKDVQQLYANQMEAYGFGRKTFVFQTDASGNAVVHHIRGKFAAAYYEHGTYVKVSEEIGKRFDLSKSIYLAVVDSGYLINGAPGVASKGDGRGGWIACINNRGSLDIKVLLTAHELGHTFGLGHDFRNRLNIMSGGWTLTHSGQPFIPVGLSKCTAELLDVHRYFNAGHQSENVSNNTQMQMLTPIADPPNAIRFRFEITDVDGLHQARLYGGTSGTIGCKRLNGNSNSTVEFTTTTVTPRYEHVYLDVIDVDGNISGKFFPIDVTHLLPSKVVSIPDVNLAAAVRKALNLAPGDVLTTLLMLELIRLNAYNRQITDLTGLEYAINLTEWLDLEGNTISDISPISGLTKLTNLYLKHNNITDVAPLAGLTQLAMLGFRGNNITDVAPLAGLTQLAILYLDDNNITDIAPLAGLAKLTNLHLDGNNITDVAPLAGLTQLTTLRLDDNNITDVAPLAGLTQLTILILGDNEITDVSVLSELTNLYSLSFPDNNVSDISALTGLARLNYLNLRRNPLSYTSINTHIPAMQAKGVDVNFDPRTYPALDIISGGGQQAAGGETLANPFVVAAIDANGTTMPGVRVTFTLIEGGGTLSTTTATTDANGRAETTLTFAGNLGRHRVRAVAASLKSLVTFTAIATAPAARLTADVNDDGVVNILDLVLVSSYLGKTGQNVADVNDDGVVNIQDLVLVAGELGAEAAAPSAWHRTSKSAPSRTTVEQWLTQAYQLSLTDVRSQRGVLLLERLLAALTPKETALLTNYPNPFNPETWIPYQLAKPVDVTLHIYSVKGALVRTLALGHQPAGMYRNKKRAAYWDGRNEQGERVASGVYFYVLTAGDFSATRKLLIRK